MSFVLVGRYSGKDDGNSALGMLKAFVLLVVSVPLAITLARVLIVFVVKT